MRVVFYSFSKRVNSTKIPSGGTAIDVLLKELTDIHNPVLKCQSSNLGQYNYFQLLGNYYWIVNEVAFPNNWIEFTGKIDAMATCHDDIMATTAYVERAQAGSVNMDDQTMPNTTNLSVVQRSDIRIYDFEMPGCYLFSVVGGLVPSGDSGIATTYALSATLLRSVAQKLSSEDFLQQMVQYFWDPYSAIVSCTWIPLLPEDVGTARGEIVIGNYQTGITATVVTKGLIAGSSGVTLEIGNDYTWTDRFCGMNLYLPFVGAVALSINDFLANRVLSINWYLDCMTGAIAYIVTDGVREIATYSGTCGVNSPVGKSTYNPVGMVVGGFQSLMQAVTGNIPGVLSGIGSIAHSARTSSQVNGGFGSRAGMGKFTAELTITKLGTPEGLSARAGVIGLPYCKTVQLGSLSGYVKCIGASISASQEYDVLEECNNYLNNGAFIE